MQWLDASVFCTVVDATPLVSIDLVVHGPESGVLLGLRKNRPAQNFWFVPGGRIHKNEGLDQAFLRLTREELGSPIARSACQSLGIYEHFYADSVFGKMGDGPSTHYVVLAYAVPERMLKDGSLPLQQHSKFRWWSVDDARQSHQVHAYTKAYLNTDF